eukprot:TRINITY_DN9132_c0_g1_i1.p1 TRINITY_DN9132_c0_g1~~TRINITY_DN9132_c0_g1_i1.p1  ORF type:complete len:132 (+),score=18.54 TRINITY_DN9132_c0_g1_i1:41-397(+)
MVAIARVTYRRRHSYNTTANRTKNVKTPGGRLIVQYLDKKCRTPHCGDCGRKLNGIPAYKPTEFRQVAKRERKVARAYGGSRCAACVKQRIIRAFLIEEQKIVKHVLHQRAHKQKKKD